jgi:hypothetical protein
MWQNTGSSIITSLPRGHLARLVKCMVGGNESRPTAADNASFSQKVGCRHRRPGHWRKAEEHLAGDQDGDGAQHVAEIEPARQRRSGGSRCRR